MKKRVLKTVGASLLAVGLMFSGVQIAHAGWEASSGTTLHSPVQIEAWAWTNVWSGTQGQAFAQVGSSKNDTGWFRNDTRTARAYGAPWDSPIEHWYKQR
jgi:hypothetical protein